MVSPKSITGTVGERSIPCDFCNDHIAVLYCRADSAKLCLLCDHEVHSANALSLKHHRSQMCHNCASAPASARCSTDNLLLCHDCDWDAHGTLCSSVSAAPHDRSPLDAFSGCPSASDLASLWGIDLDDDKEKKKKATTTQSSADWSYQAETDFDSWMYNSAAGVTLHDLMVPSGNSLVSKRQSSSYGKQIQAVVRQLVELSKREGVGLEGDGDGDGGGGFGGEDLVTDQRDWKGNVEAAACLGSGGDGVMMDAVNLPLQQQQESSFTSMLMMQTNLDPKNSERGAEGNFLWDTKPNVQGTQIWDFHLGQLRVPEESGPLEVGYGTNDAGFMMKSYGELLKEASLASKKGFGEIYGVNCSMSHEDIRVFSNNPNNPTATSESNNLPAARPSSCSAVGKQRSYKAPIDIQFSEHSVLVQGEATTAAITKADMEMLAQNRGNAMLRYREKKKSRRYDKHIRYESRKARADTRKRVKGRFVKASEDPGI